MDAEILARHTRAGAEMYSEIVNEIEKAKKIYELKVKKVCYVNESLKCVLCDRDENTYLGKMFNSVTPMLIFYCKDYHRISEKDFVGTIFYLTKSEFDKVVDEEYIEKIDPDRLLFCDDNQAFYKEQTLTGYAIVYSVDKKVYFVGDEQTACRVYKDLKRKKVDCKVRFAEDVSADIHYLAVKHLNNIMKKVLLNECEIQYKFK